MKNSDFQDARQHLEALIATVDPQRLKVDIESPLEKAGEDFLQAPPCPASPKEFATRLSEFVAHVYLRASQGTRHLSPAESLAIGTAALASVYGVHGTQGYEFALLDVLTYAHLEMGDALLNVLEWIKQNETAARVRWAYAQHVESLNWPVKCAFAELIRQIYRSETGEELFAGDPATQAPHLAELVAAFLDTDPMKGQPRQATANRSPSPEILAALLPLF
jgi:hypothetical protein